MTTLNSPCNISLLLHCHVSPEPIPSMDAPAVIEGVNELLACGAIEAVFDGDRICWYVTTDLGAAWVEALCQTPIPTLAYIDSHGKVIKA